MRHADRYTALRGQLTDVAERTIAEKGLAALKARDLAREAGCAVGTIYNVFEHLDELVLCVGSRTLAMLEATLEPVRSPVRHSSAEEAVDEIVRLALAYLEFAATHTVRARIRRASRSSSGSSAANGRSTCANSRCCCSTNHSGSGRASLIRCSNSARQRTVCAAANSR